MKEMSKKTKLYVISHTHWDREWYQDFQGYRYRLVRMMDDLIDNLEKDEEFLFFHMDGQTIVLKDYLEIRPENKERLQKLIEIGRLIIGPWYVMPDEFLISGESLVKNLQMGFSMSREFGAEPMKCGYLTDIFGHNSQMPQILNGFDIDTAVLYRGIADYPKDAFIWSSPNGSHVYAAKLERERSYSNFYFAARWPYESSAFDEEDAFKRMTDLLELSKSLSATDSILMMDGVDHIDIEPDIPKMLNFFREKFPDVEICHADIKDYFSQIRAQKDKLEKIDGSLYNLGKFGKNNQLLKNVLSSMVTIKQANDNCELLLEKYAEPLNAFQMLIGDKLSPCGKNDYDVRPRRSYLDTAWDLCIQNHAHDSICGCSNSAVCLDVLGRFRQSGQISETMIEDTLAVITNNIKLQFTADANNNILIFNPSQKAYNGVVLLTVPVRGGNSNVRFFDSTGHEIDVQILDKKIVYKPNHRLRQLINLDVFEMLTCAAKLSVPPCSYIAISYKDMSINYGGPAEGYPYGYVQFNVPKRLEGSLRISSNSFDNGIYVLTVNKTGTLNIQNKKTGKLYQDMLLFEDGIDGGDGWNYSKPQLDNLQYLNDGYFTFSTICEGPLAALLKIVRTYESNGEKMKITTLVTLVKDSPIIHFKTTIDNKARNHRLRVLFPTEMNTRTFRTKTPYDMCEWEIKAESYANNTEAETFVHPSQGVTYITDGQDSAAIYARGQYEVEVTDNLQKALALTLFRSPTHETWMPSPDVTALLEELTFEYAFSLAEQNYSESLREGEAWRANFKTLHFVSSDKGILSDSMRFLSDTSEKSLLSFVRLKDEKQLEVRYFNPSDDSESFVLAFPIPIKTANYIDFIGNHIEKADFSGNEVNLRLDRKAIDTLEITFQ